MFNCSYISHVVQSFQVNPFHKATTMRQGVDCWSSDILLLCNPVGDWLCMPSVALFTDFKTVTGNRATPKACTWMYSRWCQLRRGVFYT